MTYSYTPGSGFPSVSISTSLKDGDEDCGVQIVQFTDYALPEPNVTTYNLYALNFRRRTEP